MGIPLVVAYSAAKSTCIGLVRSLSTEWGPHGVRVNAISRLNRCTHARSSLGRRSRAQSEDSQPDSARLFGLPEHIGHAAVFLSSPAAAYINGVVLPVDGGAAESF